jgi:HK97 family phage prohead protease
VATICRFYGVPREMMAGETAGHAAYTSPEMRGTDFLTFTLRPWLYRVERAVSRLLPRTQQAKFNAGGFVRATLRDRYEAHKVGIEAGFLTRNEAASCRTARRYPKGAPSHDRRPGPFLPRRPGRPRRRRRPHPARPAAAYGVEARVLDRGRLVVETFQRGALAGTDLARIPLTATHPRDNQTLPIGVTVELEERADAAWGAWRVSKTTLGDEVLELARDGVPLGLSVGFHEVPGGNCWSPDRSRVTRTRAALDHVAVVRVPAYEGAGVVGVRGAASTRPTPALLTLARLRRG